MALMFFSCDHLITINNLNLKIMDYLKQNIEKYYANEITLEELKKVLHFLIDDIVIPDAIYTKKKIDNDRHMRTALSNMLDAYGDQDQEF